ncbi:hypothetical protein EOD41_20185 [Mucilaginibacter limnophilus]|uniref:Cytochrome B n=1 Tax=Mucilaginibacter limnophilus TaxID=1932778 RepID=A0A437MFS7_9SPHI|nr:hypothetical protein [Mucilaginibacter limnophilus]RVT96489.1 hypothetical protein EOD41_20185 [Mucilaginibacter limnophilus]
MYGIVLTLHSLVRWLVLGSLLFALYRSYRGLYGKRPYTKFENSVRIIAATAAHIQFVLGVYLYFISPVTNYFISNFSEAVHLREIRFFGMEHATMMLIAVALISTGSSKAKRKTEPRAKFKTQAIWLTIALIVILSSIPWPFSPLVHRPWLRPF